MHSLQRYRVRTCISASYCEAEVCNLDFQAGAYGYGSRFRPNDAAHQARNFDDL